MSIERRRPGLQPADALQVEHALEWFLRHQRRGILGEAFGDMVEREGQRRFDATLVGRFGQQILPVHGQLAVTACSISGYAAMNPLIA
jgi:hypothetical protein